MSTDRLETLLDTFRIQVGELEHTIRQIKGETDSNSPEAKRQKIGIIKKVVADFYQLPESVYASRIRVAEHVKMRHLALYLSRSLTNFPLSSIGLAFREGMDHGTIIHATHSILNRISTDSAFATVVSNLRLACVESFDCADLPLFNPSSK